MKYTLVYYICSVDALGRVSEDHRPLGDYTFSETPWVPRMGEFVRFRDYAPPGMPVDHNEKVGRVVEVVTMFYGTSTVIEVYLAPPSTRKDS